MKKILILSIILFLILIICCNNNYNTKDRNSSIGKSDIDLKLIGKDSFPIREINEQNVVLKLDGSFYWKDTLSSYPQIEVKEVHPGIVYFDKYYHSSHQSKIAIKSKIEFYDRQLNLIDTFSIDKNNPFIIDKNNLKIIKYKYAIAENYTYEPILNKKREDLSSYIITNSQITNQFSYSKIIYHRLWVTNNNKIIDEDSHIYILDSLGNKIFDKYFQHLNIINPILDKKAEYLMFVTTYTKTVSNSGVKNHPEGFEIWRLNPQKQIYKEINNNINMHLLSPKYQFNSNYITIKYSYPNNSKLSTNLIIFNPRDLELSKRIFNTTEWQDITNNWFNKYKSYSNLKSYFTFEKVQLDE